MSKTAKKAKKVVEEESAEEQPAEEPEEEPVEEVKPKKVKPVKVKKKKKSKGVYANYKIEEGKIKRMLPFCERCGPGYFMANHGNRYTCGHCGFTRYKPAETSE